MAHKHTAFDAAIRRRYSRHDTACVLARAFCHRMQHYFSAYVEHPLEEGQAFGQAVHDAYEEPSELRRLVEGELSARTRARVLAIRAIGR